jgi:PAS domain S-box-containing protein
LIAVVGIRTKLFLTVLVLAVPAIVLVGVLSYLGGKATVEQTTLERLTAVRAGKANQIEEYFDGVRSLARIFAKDRMIVDAMIDFDDAHQTLRDIELAPDQREAVAEYYRASFLPRLESQTDARPDPAVYLPADEADFYLQYHYIVANQNAEGEKDLLDDAGDGSEYSAVHSLIHPVLRGFVHEFGFHDLFLISGSGHIVYTVTKEVDLGTSLIDGPYKGTNLATVFREAAYDHVGDAVQLVDFAPYAPSYGEPASFMAAPIIDGAWLLGVLVLQVPVGEIDDVMTGNRDWEVDGLGETGETFLVGPDFKMRSNSRFFLEDPAGYIEAAEAAGASTDDLRQIRSFGTTILLQEVRTAAAEAAQAGETATTTATDYRGVEVLTSHAPLSIEGVEWVILSEIDADEAFARIRIFTRNLVFRLVGLLALVLVASWILSRRFVAPIVELDDAAGRFAAGEEDVEVPVASGDELGGLARSFNQMVSAIRQKTAELQKTAEELEGVSSVILRWDTQGRILFMNDYGLKLFGFTADEVVGEPLAGSIVPASEVVEQNIRRMIDEIAADPARYESDETENQRKDGGRIWMAWRNTPILGDDGRLREILTIGIDITERRRIEREIAEQKQLLENTLESLTHPFYVIDAEDYTIKVANSAARVLGARGESTCHALTHKSATPCNTSQHTCPMVEVKKTGRPVTVEHIHDDADGNPRFMEVNGYPIFDDDGNVVQMIEYSIDITERREAEGQLRKLSQAVEQSSSSVVITDLAGCIEYANPKFTEITGYELEEVMGQNPRVLKSGSQPQEFYADLWATISSGREWHGEFCNRKKNGELYWESASISPIQDTSGEITHYVAIKDDITEQKRVGEELKKSEERIRTMVDNIPGVVYRCLMDDAWTMLFISDEIQVLSGYPASDFLGEQPNRTFASIMHEDDLEPIAKSAQKAVDARVPYTNEYRVIDKEGNVHWVYARGKAIYADDGTPLYLDGTIFDVTEKKVMELQLEDARDAAEAANRAKSTFLANMSHELRTPMNAIIGYSEMLAEDAEDEGHDEIVPDLEKINAAGKHLLALINDILDLSKIEAGRMDLFLETFNLRHMLDEAVATVLPLITKNENKLETDFPDDLGTVRVDLTKLRQALFNLLSNAAKFTEGGVVTLAAEKELRHGAEWLKLSVTDTGIGIREDKLEAVFEEFSQADDSTTRDYGGTGLGLPISRRFCQMMGGDITVVSELGTGTTFTIELPARVDAFGEAKTAAKPEHPDAREVAPGVRPILVVDDDPNSRELLQRTLESEGFTVVTAETGEEGLELARELRPSLMTLDVLMPSMDGWSVLQEVKADPELENIPVMMISIAGDKDLGYTLGAVECLTKPVDRDKLRQLASQYAATVGGGRALVVDDDQGIRSLFQRALSEDGWTVDEAENGAIALELAKKTRPDLVLLDLMMPVMDGFEFVMHFRKLEGCRLTPVIVVTAKDLDQSERENLLGGVERIVEKGALTRQQLLKQVRELVSQHGVSADGEA